MFASYVALIASYWPLFAIGGVFGLILATVTYFADERALKRYYENNPE